MVPNFLLAVSELGGAPTPDYGGYLLICGGLLGGLGLLAYCFRRVCGGALKKRASQRSLEVLDVLPLGNRQRLAVVRCYDRTIVLGVAEKGISLVTEIELEPGEFLPGEVEPAGAPAQASPGGTFVGALSAAGAPAALPVASTSAGPEVTPMAPQAAGVSAAGASATGVPAERRASAAELVAQMRREGVLG